MTMTMTMTTPMTITAQQCFAWATEITRCQNYQELTYAFTDLLQNLDGIHTAHAYEVYGNRKKRKQTHSSDKTLVRRLPLNFSAEEDNCPLLTDRELPDHIEIVISDDSKTQAILPIKTDLGPDRAILLEGSFNSETIKLLDNLLSLYRNQVLLHDQSERDILTRLPNRQSFEARLMEVCEGCHDTSLNEKRSWIAMLDIDHFKAVNDNFGHLYGDEVLLHFSQLMESKFRYIDFIFRFGGEEFVVILNNINKIEAQNSLNRFRMAVENYNFPLVGKITVSIGATLIQENSVFPPSMLDRADKALYFAKDNGRNQVIMFEDMVEEETLPDCHSDIELF